MHKARWFSYLISIGVLLITYQEAFAQMPDYHIRIFGPEKGIQAGGVRDMAVGRDGFLWLLSSDHVSRFDGRNLKIFNLDGLLISIEVGRNNEIWVNSMKKLYRFKNDHLGFVPVKVDTQGAPHIISIIGLSGRKQRLLTTNGFYRLDSSENMFIKDYSLESPINDGAYMLIHSYGLIKSTFFYASNDTIYALDLKTGTRQGMYIYDLANLYPIDNHSVIASTWKGQSFLYDFATMTINPVGTNAFLKRNNKGFVSIAGFCPLKEESFLLADYNSGLVKYDISEKGIEFIQLYYNGKPFPKFRTSDVYKDRTGRIWIASTLGLLTFNPGEPQIGLVRNWENEPSKAFSNQIRNFAVDEEGNLWLATLNGFAYFNLKEWTITPYFPTEGATDRLNHPSIRGIVYDGKYLIIGQSNLGIWLYNPDSKEYRRPPNTPILKADDFIDLFYTLKNGNYVIVAREEVYLMDKNTYRIQTIDYPGEKYNPSFCFQDNQGRVWIGSGNHLYVFDEKMNYQVTFPYDFEDYLFSMCQINENEFYVGTRGLYKLTLSVKDTIVNKVKAFNDESNFTIIYYDKQGKLWLGTINRIYSYDILTGKIEKYGYYDNVQSGLFYINSCYRFPDGLLFMGGKAGINYFYPEKMKGHNDSLAVVLLDITVNGKSRVSYPDFTELALNYKQSDVEITFTAPFFDDPEKVKYRYKLKSVNDEWVYLKHNNTVRFASLSPGEYSFIVAAGINGRDWYEISVPVEFTISPPFWKRWWFWGILLLLVGIILYYWIRHLRRQVRAQEITTAFATSLFSQNTVENTFWNVAQNCVTILGFEDCVIYEYDREKENLIQVAAAGPKGNPKSHRIIDAIEIPLGKGIVGSVAQSQKPEIVKDTRKDSRYILDDDMRLSEIAVPIIVDGKIFGVIDSEHSEKGYYTRWHLKVMEKIAHLCSEKISRYLTAERIRRKIAQDLHDDMGSTLTSINIISKIAMKQSDNKKDIHDHLQKIKRNSSQMMESLSDIIWAINPEHDTLEEIGLYMKEYTAELLEPAGIAYSFEHDRKIEEIRFNLSKRKDMFLIFKETLNNALKYSSASKIDICLRKESDNIVLSIKDNGSGFDPKMVSKGNGLKNMQARANNINAILSIESEKNMGTIVTIRIPIT